MTPLFDPRPWGTHDLSPIYPQQFKEKIGESWLTGDHCKVQNGPLAGKSLAELASQYKRELVGDAPAGRQSRSRCSQNFCFRTRSFRFRCIPMTTRARLGQPCGKTECWYVAHAEPGAEIGLGLKSGVTVAQFEQAISENRAEEFLNWIKVFTGDMIYVAGGTVHTLGPGSIIVETQQQSDTTFRLYDYGRPRELHLQQGLRVIKENAASGKVKPRSFPGIWTEMAITRSAGGIDLLCGPAIRSEERRGLRVLRARPPFGADCGRDRWSRSIAGAGL